MSKFDPNIFKMGYFILYKSNNSFFSRQIVNQQRKAGFITDDACYTHVEVSGGGVHSTNISPPISKLIDITKVHKGREACVMRYKKEDYERKGRYKVAYFSASLCNKGYDYRGVLSFIFKQIKQGNRGRGVLSSIFKHIKQSTRFRGVLSFIFKWIKQSNRLWFCSEGASWALQKEYPQALLYKAPQDIMPAHFRVPKYFECVWEGIIT